MNQRAKNQEVREATMQKLKERGIEIAAIAEIVYEMQKPYNDELTMDLCIESVEAVLKKRELQHAILVGIELDILAEKNLLSEPLLTLVRSDEGLFGCDETLALGSVFGYGSIAVTTFGHLDKHKIGLIKQLDTKKDGPVNTFMDDLVASIAAAASGRLAHRLRDIEEEDMTSTA